MLPKKRTRTLRWAGRLGCLALAGTLVMPPVALARDYQPDRGQDSQVIPQKPQGHKGEGQQKAPEGKPGHPQQVIPQKPAPGKPHSQQVAPRQQKPPQQSHGRNYQPAPGKQSKYQPAHHPQVVPKMPPNHRSYNYHGTRYYYHGGVYYRPYNRGYIVVRPPRGLFVDLLPIGFATLLIAGITYYTFAGIYYRTAPGGYVVVDAPAGVVVTSPAAPAAEAPSAPIGTAVVTSPLLNVRSGPGMNYSVVTTVMQGYSLNVYGTAPGWLYVQAPTGQFGWVAQSFTNYAPIPTPSG